MLTLERLLSYFLKYTVKKQRRLKEGAAVELRQVSGYSFLEEGFSLAAL